MFENLTDFLTTAPKRFLKWSIEPNKAEITKAIKGGETVSGAALVENQSLQVR